MQRYAKNEDTARGRFFFTIREKPERVTKMTTTRAKADQFKTSRGSYPVQSVLGHVVIYQLFIESYSGRILVPLDINNNYPKYFFQKFGILHVYITNYVMGCIYGRSKIQNVQVILNGVLKDAE